MSTAAQMRSATRRGVLVQRCLTGRHRPVEVQADPRDPDIRRAVCRDCGCALHRTLITRRWSISGLIG